MSILSTLSTTTTTTTKTTTSPSYFSPPKTYELSESEDRASLNSYTYNQEELYNSYNPEIGVRIATALASMIALLALYLAWSRFCSSSRHVKLDMEFWLDFVDRKSQRKRQQQQQQRNCVSFDSLESWRLPEGADDSEQATANWILEHQYLLDEMPRIPNKYFLTELETRREDNYVNKELLLFRERIDFPHGDLYEEMVLNSLNFKFSFKPFRYRCHAFVCLSCLSLTIQPHHID